MNGTIADALKRARKGHGQFAIDDAVNDIFAQSGQKFAFLFNQNARRTNIQVAELLALVRIHTYRTETREREPDLEFTTFDEVKRFLQSVLDHGDVNNDRNFSAFINEISRYLQDKVLIEALYGSLSVFLPPHLSMDVDLVCGESGYVHSCGELLLLRNAEKVTEAKFLDEVDKCIQTFGTDDSCFLIVPFCHEDFSKHDRDTTPFLQYGLDDVKINMSKAFIGSKKLYDLLEDVGERFEDDVAIAPAGDFRVNARTSSVFGSSDGLRGRRKKKLTKRNCSIGRITTWSLISTRSMG